MATTQKPDVASDLPTKCGCGGDIVSGSGCGAYLGSEDYSLDYDVESMMWAGGLGFGSAVLDSPSEAIMSMHLQENGLTPEQTEQLLRRPMHWGDVSELAVVIPEDQREYTMLQLGDGPHQHD